MSTGVVPCVMLGIESKVFSLYNPQFDHFLFDNARIIVHNYFFTHDLPPVFTILKPVVFIPVFAVNCAHAGAAFER
jgi:hypothetical protein